MDQHKTADTRSLIREKNESNEGETETMIS